MLAAHRTSTGVDMDDITRRRFIAFGAGVGAAVGLPWPSGSPVASAATPGKLAKYVQPLPLPGAGLVVATPTAANTYAFRQREIRRQLHPQLPPTPVWAYDDGSGLVGQAGSFGMIIAARSGTPVTASFTNALPAEFPAWLPVDLRLTPSHDRTVRVTTHLHGGFVAGDSDGNPAVRPGGFTRGQVQHVVYPNELPQQPASLLWFHDHGMGTTRLGVFAGLAGGYVLRDAFDTGAEPNPIGIPGGAYEIPLVIQDRQFNADGTFRYPAADFPDAPWIGEYFGDVMLVNGKVWPFLDVEPRMYRFRVLNGCNSRILNLDLGGAPLWQIGAEGGLWDEPVPVKRIVLAPAERADLVIDFSKMAGQTLTVGNTRPPKPVVTPAQPLPQVMQIRVGTTVTRRGPRTIPASLPGRAANLPSPSRTRFITLNETEPETADWFLNLNGVRFDEGPITEKPKQGSIEDWVYVNLTADTHPMHSHLVTAQVVGRTPFDAEAYEDRYGGPRGVPGGIDPTPFATGPMRPPEPTERGFKDTVKANPGYFTTVRAKYDLPSASSAPQTYVYHCHIVEHEDNDMMRPFTVIP
jgi:spore coat protein A, manganese oxidase